MATTQKTETTVRYIWKCRNSNCKHIFAIDYLTSWRGTWRVIEQESIGYRKEIVIMDDINGLRCPKCTSYRPKGTRVEGHYVEGRKCSAKCRGATRGVCECECGGENHGANHL